MKIKTSELTGAQLWNATPEAQTLDQACVINHSVMTKLRIATDALTEIATAEPGATNDLEHEVVQDLIATAQDALHKIKESK